jgi:hypothetical protein
LSCGDSTLAVSALRDAEQCDRREYNCQPQRTGSHFPSPKWIGRTI